MEQTTVHLSSKETHEFCDCDTRDKTRAFLKRIGINPDITFKTSSHVVLAATVFKITGTKL